MNAQIVFFIYPKRIIACGEDHVDAHLQTIHGKTTLLDTKIMCFAEENRE